MYTDELENMVETIVGTTKNVLTATEKVAEARKNNKANDGIILPDYFNDQNLEDVTKALGDSAEENERIKKLREILELDAKSKDIEDVEPELGESSDIPGVISSENLDTSEYSDLNLIDIAINGIKEKKLSLDDIKNRSKDFMPMASDDTIMQMLEVARRYKAGERFSIYGALPKPLQIMLMHGAGEFGNNRSMLNASANLLMDQFCTEVLDAAMGQEIVDFNYAIKEAFNIPSIVEMYEGYTRDRFSKELVEKAEKLEAEGFKAGAKVLRDCSQAYIDTYTFVRQKAALTGKTKRKLYKDNWDYSRYVEEFNYRISKTPYKTRDVNEMGKTLQELKMYTGMDDEDIKAFVILFVKTCNTLDPNNTADAMFMCYSIQNITNIHHHEFLQVKTAAPEISDISVPEFDQQIIDGIRELVCIMHNIKAEREGKK